MDKDALIKKRFAELNEKAERVAKTRYQSDNGKINYVSTPMFTEWATSVRNLLQRAFREDSVHYQQFAHHADHFRAYESHFRTCLGIFNAAHDDYENGYLFNLRSLIKAEVLDDALEQAKALLDGGYKDPACVVVGISLEVALKDICTRNNIDIAKMDKMNADIARKGLYNVAKQKQITAWADLRNKSAHGQWAEYNEADVKDMLQGVERFIADYL